MAKTFPELVIGNLDEKRAWKQQMKRVQALPSSYRSAFKKIQHYGYQFGFCFVTQSDLLELFEDSAAAGRTVTEVIGHDAAAFCDELMCASQTQTENARETLNREIAAHFSKEVQ